MGFAEIKENAKGLSEKERRELVAFLVHLEQSADPDYLDRITWKIDETESLSGGMTSRVSLTKTDGAL